jgi:NADH-ubiquinone oxidoreductase chain 6
LFCLVSTYLILVNLTFIGISYLLVYVGAVSILFLFILMLINIRISDLISNNNNYLPLAIFSIIFFVTILGQILPNSKKVLIIEKEILNKFLYNENIHMVTSNN